VAAAGAPRALFFPYAAFCCFGQRPKLKPFSSLVLLEDQNQANPVPDQPDPEGSWTDARILAEYVYLAAERMQSYDGQLMGIFAGPELSRALVTPGPERRPLENSARRT
jgi:hypothetical protein